MMMWDAIAARIAENDAEEMVPLRRILLTVLQAAGAAALPDAATKKMVGMQLASGERLVWEIDGQARNFFVASKWAAALEGAGFSPDPRPFVAGERDGKRHSALNRAWSFPGQDCLRVIIESGRDLQLLLEALGAAAPTLALDPAAVARWISRLRQFFPDLDRFDRPDPVFDARERDYKLQVAARLRAAIAEARDDATVLAAVHDGLVKSNLLPWRAYWSMSPKGDGDAARLAPALRALVEAAQGPAVAHPQALADFAAAWAEAVPNPQRDHARQIGEFVLLHLAPETAVYMRASVREAFWREGFGTKFPASSDLAETYRLELQFMQAVRDAFSARGLAPRDMIDIQSALWVVHNYTDNEAEPAAEAETTMPEFIPSTNLILYGPPGTGKTYATAWEAVKICLGAEAAPLENDRPALMAAYKRLCDEGRIEFTTFHQSMSYEDFVEGLRPETGEGEGAKLPEGEARSVGFSLRPHDGLFRRISERARLDKGEGDATPRLDRERRIVKLGLTGDRWARDLDRVLTEGRIDWPHGGAHDWSDPQFEDWEAIKAIRQLEAPNLKGNHATIYGTWVVRFAAQIGDYVMLTVGKDKVVAFGRFAGPYEFVPATPEAPARHLRPVEWLWSDAKGIARAQVFRNVFTSLHPIYFLEDDAIEWDGIEQTVFGDDFGKGSRTARPHVLIIDEINRANISKVFGELITLLEPDKRLGAANEIRLRLPYSGRSFGVPANLHIIGTMNTADRSIALLDTALRRRFTFRELMPDVSVLPADCGGVNLQKLLATLNVRIEYLFDREHQIGHAYFTACATRDDVAEVMRFKIIPLLAEYFYEDWSKVAAVLGDGPGRPERFLRAVPLSPPPGLGEDEINDTKVRWQLLDAFDFADFAA